MYAGTYLSVAFLGFHSRVLGQQLFPKVPDNHGSLAAGPSYFFSPEVAIKNFFVGNPIHESIMTRNNKTRKFYYTKISRYTVYSPITCIYTVLSIILSGVDGARSLKL